MLVELHIENLGVIDRLDLPLASGMTALTGETGAGKTMLVEAISLLVGGRADAGIVRHGTTEARIEGRFVDDDEEFVIARVIPADGRSRGYINGRLATVGQLEELGRRLVDLHGQHAHQSLLVSGAQRDALDRFGAIDAEPLRAARHRISELRQAIEALGGDARSRARELDLLRFQLDEIATAAISDPDEETLLDREQDVLADASAHRQAAQQATEGLVADAGVIDLLRAVLTTLGTRLPTATVADRVRGAIVELEDCVGELRAISEVIEENPQRLAELRHRRQMLRDLRRKYGETLSEVLQYFTETSARHAELASYDERLAVLEHEMAAAQAEYSAASDLLLFARRAAATPLADQVSARLRLLAMPHAVIEIAVDGQAGQDVHFLLSANPGSVAQPLNKVASGGELARTMLALRLVLTAAPEVLIFDEVDAGIGGAAALSVGQALAELAGNHQVLVVTHLAQVAACADHQVAVSKIATATSTTAAADPIDGEQRVIEISRMLSGVTESKAAREHALELLQSPTSV